MASGCPATGSRDERGLPESGRLLRCSRGRFLRFVGALPRPLMDAHDDVLGRPHRRDADLAGELPHVARLGWIRLLVALHVEGFVRGRAGERPLLPELVEEDLDGADEPLPERRDRKSTRLNSSHANISYA